MALVYLRTLDIPEKCRTKSFIDRVSKQFLLFVVSSNEIDKILIFGRSSAGLK